MKVPQKKNTHCTKKAARRQQKKIRCAVVCEGKAEHHLWTWLRSCLREARDVSVAIPVIENVRGGDCLKIIRHAFAFWEKNKKSKDVTHLVVMMDTDHHYNEAKKEIDTYRTTKKGNTTLCMICCFPCFEHFLLTLKGQKMPKKITSSSGKKEHIKTVYGCEPHEINWSACSLTYRDVFKTKEFSEIRKLFEPVGLRELLE